MTSTCRRTLLAAFVVVAAASLLTQGCSSGPCGKQGQPCCGLSFPPQPQCENESFSNPTPLACVNGGTCQPCGGEGQPCCTLQQCPGSRQCVSKNGPVCITCGGDGQQCCENAYSTTECQNGFCGAKTPGFCGMPAGTQTNCTAQCSGAGAVLQWYGLRKVTTGCAYSCLSVTAPQNMGLACATCLCTNMFNDKSCEAVLVSNQQSCIQYTAAATDPSGVCQPEQFIALNDTDATMCAKSTCDNCMIQLRATCPQPDGG